MRYLIFSDVHGNLEALDACLARAVEKGFDRVLVLGDVVGYGADPNAVIDRVIALNPAAIIRGNHDKAASGIESADGFNAVARSSAQWTHAALSNEHRAWLSALPQGPLAVDDVIEICHGAPFDEDTYVFDELDAVRAIRTATRPLCLFGHTHWPVTFSLTNGAIAAQEPSDDAESSFVLASDSRYLVNPGSVGQPRDGDPRAAFAIVDTDAKRVERYRVSYEIASAQEKIVNAGLPDVLAKRLAVGR